MNDQPADAWKASPALTAALKELAYCLSLLEWQPPGNGVLVLDPIPSAIEYCRRIVKLAEGECDEGLENYHGDNRLGRL